MCCVDEAANCGYLLDCYSKGKTVEERFVARIEDELQDLWSLKYELVMKREAALVPVKAMSYINY